MPLAEHSLSPEAGEPPDVRTSHPAHQQRLHGVILVVPCEHDGDPGGRGLRGERLVASVAGAGLDVATLGVDLGHAPRTGHPELGAQAGAERGVVVGFIASQSVVHVDGEDLGAILRASQEMKEVHAVGAAAEGHRDRR